MVQGASRGIGLALIEALLEAEGVGRVVATSREPDCSKGLAPRVLRPWGPPVPPLTRNLLT
jgi:NAD(P)-dependent dehydrogenase (short-subunit alcohol dehydrogenase family)